MDWSEVLCQIDGLINRAKHCEVMHVHTPDWTSLDYSANGVSVLFEEFRKVSSWADHLSFQFQPIAVERSDIVRILRDSQASQEIKVSKELSENAKKWALSGLAANERLLMARMNTADAELGWQKVQYALDCLDGHISIVKARIKRLDDFKYAAQLLRDTLNFGHALQDLPLKGSNNADRI